MVATFACLVMVVCVPQEGSVLPWSATMPPALQAFLNARSAETLRTGSIEWSFEEAERPGVSGWRRYYSCQVAQDRVAMTDWGDDEGVVMRGPDSAPATYDYTGPGHFLLDRDQLWWHIDRAPGARVFPGTREAADSMRVVDARKIGMDTTVTARTLYEQLRTGAGADVRYASVVEDGLHVVTADVHGMFLRWWIDPARGWNAVRSAMIRDGKTEAYSTTRLRQWGEAWFPESVAYFADGYRDGREPYVTICVSAAGFNAPDDPQELSPADIGVEVGTDVIFQDPAIRPGLQYWDGQKLVTQDEFFARLQRGELRRGPTVERELARLREKNYAREVRDRALASGPASRPTSRPSRARWESEWEAYTRRFIARFKLVEDQTQKAQQVLKDCQEQAHQYLDRHKAAFEELDRRVEALATLDDEAKRKGAEALLDERHKLMQPVDDIFEQHLKPRLDKLPTRTQRRAAHAEERPDHQGATSQPAGRPRP